MGWRRLFESQLVNRPTNSRKKRSLAARLGDSFYFAISKIVESLLRRGARDFSLHFATQTQQNPLWGRRARGAARHSNRASRLQPALSARWRILAKQHELFRQYPTPAVAHGSSYPDELKLRSGRAGSAK